MKCGIVSHRLYFIGLHESFLLALLCGVRIDAWRSTLEFKLGHLFTKLSPTPLATYTMSSTNVVPQKRKNEDNGHREDIVKDGSLTSAAENFFEALCV